MGRHWMKGKGKASIVQAAGDASKRVASSRHQRRAEEAKAKKGKRE